MGGDSITGDLGKKSVEKTDHIYPSVSFFRLIALSRDRLKSTEKSQTNYKICIQKEPSTTKIYLLQGRNFDQNSYWLPEPLAFKT